MRQRRIRSSARIGQKQKRCIPTPANAADFELLAWANQILSDPEKREQYDALGYADIRSEHKRASEAWTLMGRCSTRN
jgi:DnaJ-class molecular chaperone